MSVWTDTQWATLFAVLKRGFKSREEWSEADESVYRALLADSDPAAVIEALKAMVAEGVVFRPVPGELVNRSRRDPGRPTYDEMVQLVRRALRAKPTQRTWGSEGERQRLFDQAALDAATAAHPLVGSFLTAFGIDRFRALRLDDPDWKDLAHRDLRTAWEEHTSATGDREAVALARGGDTRAGLRRLDPLSHLKPDPAVAGELTEATS